MADEQYFELPELRALPDLDDAARFSDARLTAARAWITGVIERVCQTSFVTRTRTAELHPEQLVGRLLELPDSWVRQVIGGNIVRATGTTALTAEQVQQLTVRYGQVRLPRTWWPTHLDAVDRVMLDYLAGWSAEVPADLKEAALQAARSRVLTVDGNGGVPSRALGITNEYGNIRLAAAGKDAPTGIPDVDAVLVSYRDLTHVLSA